MTIYVLVTKEYVPVEEPGYEVVQGENYPACLRALYEKDLPETFGVCQEDHFLIENGRLLSMGAAEKLLEGERIVLGSEQGKLAFLCQRQFFKDCYENCQKAGKTETFEKWLPLFCNRENLTPRLLESRDIDTGRIREMLSLLYEVTAPLIAKYNAGDYLQYYPLNEAVGKTGGIPVWVCWWQGLDEAPRLVKECVHRMKKYFTAPDWEFHLITFDNLDAYTGFSETIVNRYNSGAITMTHLSDILRAQLLNMYGGLWLDATYWFYDETPLTDIKNYPFYTQKSGGEYNELDVVQGRWANNFLKGPAGFPLFGFLIEAFELYWEKYDTLKNYFLIDFLDAVAYEKIPMIKALFDAVPVNHMGAQLLAAWGNEPYDAHKMEVLLSTTKVFKMTYKKELLGKTKDGKTTFYGAVLENAFEL